MKRLEAFLFNTLGKRQFDSDNELYNYVILFAVALIACGVHVLFTVFFFLAGCTPLAVSHFMGVLVFIWAAWLLLHKKYDFAGILLSVMILFSTFATVYCIGGNNYSLLYQVIVLIMLAVVPFKNRKIPVIASALLPFIMVGTHLYDLGAVAPFEIGKMNEVLSLINIVVNSTGIILLLSLERLVRRFINRFNDEKIKELQDQAYLDPLTGLYNRRYADICFKKMKTERRRGQSCVAIADLDDFKRVNDTLGHEAGDIVLKTISQILLDNMRKTDYVFRWGGEEFLLIIHNTQLPHAYSMLDRIRQIIEQTTILYERQDIQITITMGIARLDPLDPNKSIEQCDQLMYEGKRSGKNKVVR